MNKQIKKFEAAWTRYIESLKRLDERRANGQRRDRARYGIRRARANLHSVCAELGVEAPRCA